MKNYAKVGNRKGQPAYRTPASFRRSLRYRLQKPKPPYNKACVKN